MLTVYKYPVRLEDSFQIGLPLGAQVLSFQVQHGQPFIWALVDVDSAIAPRAFRLAGTGHAIGHDAAAVRFVGTAQFHGGDLVFRLFEVLS